MSRCGINSVIGKVCNKNEDNYITLSKINDENHNIKGIYAFDPSMDTIYKNQYKNNLARRMNYNFFCCTLDKLKLIYPKRNMQDFLRVLASDDMMEFNHSIDLINNRDNLKIIEKEFGFSLEQIWKNVTYSEELSNDNIIHIITKILERYPEDILDKKVLTRVITDNYINRNNELFTNKYVKKLSKNDTTN